METKQPKKSTVIYPLGGCVYASVKTRGGNVKLHLVKYRFPSNTKGGRLTKSSSFAMNMNQFQQLSLIRNTLETALAEHTEALCSRIPDYVPRPSSFQAPYSLCPDTLLTPGAYLTQVPQCNLRTTSPLEAEMTDSEPLNLVEKAAQTAGILPCPKKKRRKMKCDRALSVDQ